MKKSLLVAVLALVATSAMSQTYIYNSRDGQTATVAGTIMAAGVNTSDTWGDQVTLAGTAREVTLFDEVLQFNNATGETGNFLLTCTTSFYAMSGTDVGTQLWTQDWTINQAAGAWLFTFNVPNIVVPDEMVFATSFVRQAGSNTGSVNIQAHASPPSVGYSDPTFFWSKAQSSSTWTHAWFSGNTNSNFRARITAVPEPATMATLAVGALALLRRRRR